ncbi:unnamed protein product [Sympodiomycopsis kandeliae]
MICNRYRAARNIMNSSSNFNIPYSSHSRSPIRCTRCIDTPAGTDQTWTLLGPQTVPRLYSIEKVAHLKARRTTSADALDTLFVIQI